MQVDDYYLNLISGLSYFAFAAYIYEQLLQLGATAYMGFLAISGSFAKILFY